MTNKAHAKLSASGSARWLNCPGSVAAESGRPDSRSGAAAEGTAAHELADLCLRNDYSADHYLDRTIEGYVVTPEMVDHVQGYIDYVRDLARGGQLLPEQRVDFSPWVIDGFGTSDAIIFAGTVCHIVDLKYGKGVPVAADNNSQAMLYALGVYNDFGMLFDEVEAFELHIYQPRIGNFSRWRVTLTDLLKWGEWVRLRVDMTTDPDAERVPGDKQCTFCKAKGDCPALLAYTERLIMAEFDDLDDLPDPHRLTRQQLTAVLTGKKLIESWLSAVEASVYERMTEGGESFDGLKIVAGRSSRSWRDEAMAAEMLLTLRDEQEVYSRKLISPAQAEKLLGRKVAAELADHIVKSDGKPVMVPATDPRKSINDCAECFDDLDA
ncbi:MAG: DUF2800 domain-containing protein [Shewanella sp.]